MGSTKKLNPEKIKRMIAEVDYQQVRKMLRRHPEDKKSAANFLSTFCSSRSMAQAIVHELSKTEEVVVYNK